MTAINAVGKAAKQVLFVPHEGGVTKIILDSIPEIKPPKMTPAQEKALLKELSTPLEDVFQKVAKPIIDDPKSETPVLFDTSFNFIEKPVATNYIQSEGGIIEDVITKRVLDPKENFIRHQSEGRILNINV